MRTRESFMLAVLVLALGVLASASANAGILVDCSGVRYHGWVGSGDLGRLEQRLHLGPDSGYPIVQNEDVVFDGYGGFDITIPWNVTPDGWWYRAAWSFSGDGGVSWNTRIVEEGVLYCLQPDQEGCSPGYWKNHLEDWPSTGFSAEDDFDTVFFVDLFDPDITLGDAVNLGGGGVKKLARHGAAALLSAAHPDVDYPSSVAGVIALVQAGEVGPLVDGNELGCLIP